MKQKIVIRVHMSCDKCRSKALALVAATGGVDSVAIAGDGKDQVVVVGEGVDSVKLTSALRKKVGPAQILQVGEAKKEEKKPAAAYPAPLPVWCYAPPSQPASFVCAYPYGYGFQMQQEDSSCSIM